MTVQEMIAALQVFPPDMCMAMLDDYGSLSSIQALRVVHAPLWEMDPASGVWAKTKRTCLQVVCDEGKAPGPFESSTAS